MTKSCPFGFIAMADEIWANPELALAEFKACKLQKEAFSFKFNA